LVRHTGRERKYEQQQERLAWSSRFA